MPVSKEIKETIVIAIEEVFKKMGSVSWIERKKAIKGLWKESNNA